LHQYWGRFLSAQRLIVPILARSRGVASYAAAAECDFIWRVMATAIGYYYIFPCKEYGG